MSEIDCSFSFRFAVCVVGNSVVGSNINCYLLVIPFYWFVSVGDLCGVNLCEAIMSIMLILLLLKNPYLPYSQSVQTADMSCLDIIYFE